MIMQPFQVWEKERQYVVDGKSFLVEKGWSHCFKCGSRLTSMKAIHLGSCAKCRKDDGTIIKINIVVP